MEESDITQVVQGKVIYLLALVVLVQSIYPITQNNAFGPLIIYQLLYSSLIIVGIVLVRDTPGHQRLVIASGLLWLVGGVLFAIYPTEPWARFVAYASIILFQVLVTQVLLRFIFQARKVTRDVLYAASAVYLLLGAIFVPIYGMLETMAPGSFVDGTLDNDLFFPWQHFVYYSYATLTTLGYGDILPLSMWAKSLASMEAVIGVLYLTIIMARLVGLYAQEQGD